LADIPGDKTTTATVTVGSTTNGNLEVVGDHDWYKINLTAGQSIKVTINGVTLEDPYLYIRNSVGTVLFENDDISSGVIRDSQIAFSANYTGVYYIDVGAFEDSYAGTFQVVVSTYTPPPLATVDQFANQLVSGYWGGDSHHFNVSQGGTITVNLTGLTADGQNLARAALAQWTDIIGVSFQEVTSGGQITFDDSEQGAFTDANWSLGITTSAHVNVSTQWLTDYGTSLNSYSFQTYIHEIGHALGLGHAGNYNGDARYPYDASFQNDAWSMSVMSYFSPTENTYFAGQGFTDAFVVTPMMVDIAAMQQLYGLSTTTRAGDTTYGPSWPTAMGALCIFDSGGIDTINCANQLPSTINLTPGSFSTISGQVGLVSIAQGVIIENAIGSVYNDNLIGNDVDNVLSGGGGSDTLTGGAGNDTLTGGTGADTLTGGSGSDTFRDTKAGLNGETIADLGAGDKIVLTDATLAGFTFSVSGHTLSFTGGSLILTTLPAGTLVASAAVGGGVQLTFGLPHDPDNDFNGDGKSDILWRSDSGQLGDWLGQAGGTFAANPTLVGVPASWHVVGTGDFNGDTRDDILWRSDSGQLGDWVGQADGNFAVNPTLVGVPAEWKVAGTGDFNGDSRDDILWRSDDGRVGYWFGQADGNFAVNPSIVSAPVEWKIVGTGDFNGDGRDDILWRSDSGAVGDWLGQADGSFAVNASIVGVPIEWKIVGTGDFNGDGRDDILWRNDSGGLQDWLGQQGGNFTPSGSVIPVPLDWHVADVGDYDGDSRDDILWRNDGGAVGDWLGQADGSFAVNPTLVGVPGAWHIQSPDNLWL
jgi:Ca2+-binding RTX toxin-like protein